jgi:hypothetical protein
VLGRKGSRVRVMERPIQWMGEVDMRRWEKKCNLEIRLGMGVVLDTTLCQRKPKRAFYAIVPTRTRTPYLRQAQVFNPNRCD